MNFYQPVATPADYSLLIACVLIAALVSALIAAAITADRTGSYVTGLGLGIIFSVIGIFIAAVLPENPIARESAKTRTTHRVCPHCQELMRRQANTCPHCQQESTAWELHDGKWWMVGADGSKHWLDAADGSWKRWDNGWENSTQVDVNP